VRFQIKTCTGVLTWLFVLTLLAGCGATAHFASYDPHFGPTVASRFRVGTIIDSSDPLKRGDLPPTFNPSTELKTNLEAKLTGGGLIVDATSPDTIALIPTITDYDPGNAALRWLAPGAGSTVLTVRCDIQQHGVSVGKINVRRTVEFGGVYSIGQWSIIFGRVAGDIVDKLKDKVAQGR